MERVQFLKDLMDGGVQHILIKSIVGIMYMEKHRKK